MTASPNGARPPGECAQGVLELAEKSPPSLRDPKRHLVPRADDPQIARALIQKFSLRGGETLVGPATMQPGPKGQKVRQVSSLLTINGIEAAKWTAPPPIQDTTAIDPHQLIHFDTPGGPVSMRVVQLFTPIGRGQRGLIVSPPRSGKTILLQQMAHGIAVNHPDIYMIVLLIDERPEEVTEMRRSVRGEVIASSNDLDVDSHVRVARLVIERAKRMVELGEHVVVLLDSLTRLGRAFNSFVGSSGRTMTGGLDIRALQEPKQIFGAARAVEDGGTLTIIATALVDTGSRADNFIFEEFKGTGNMELVLNRELANLRLWPALNIPASGTRKEEKLLDAVTLKKAYMLRRHLSELPPAKQIETLVERMSKYEDLKSYLASIQA